MRPGEEADAGRGDDASRASRGTCMRTIWEEERVEEERGGCDKVGDRRRQHLHGVLVQGNLVHVGDGVAGAFVGLMRARSVSGHSTHVIDDAVTRHLHDNKRRALGLPLLIVVHLDLCNVNNGDKLGARLSESRGRCGINEGICGGESGGSQQPSSRGHRTCDCMNFAQ